MQEQQVANVPQASVDQESFTLREFLAEYKLSYHSYRRLVKQGKGPKLVTLGPRKIRVRRDTAAEWFKNLEAHPEAKQ